MADQVTRDNHYVPIWYQRGFLERGKSKLYLLDTTPDQLHLHDGRIVSKKTVRHLGPASCFVKYDLYTTRFGSFINDEIEKHLFGAIDDKGAKAVRAFIKGDLSEMHALFHDFFEYLDAQKLRTPKGLDWIKSLYPKMNQIQLMRELQGLRLIHCAMWAEAVREIVSAEDSDVKFIVTDHPITTYNAELPPTSPECSYPQDPLSELVGTQTVFALDANTCLILTHLEYAQKPKYSKLTVPRTNARHYGHGLVRTDAFIRKRKLLRDEVIAINYLLKSRAQRYLASATQEWLYPERLFTGKWADIAKTLLPQDDLWRFGGEIYVGYKDGSTYYQDAFGRTSDSHNYLKRKKLKSDIGPNEPCGCGSGRKFKHCCQAIPKEFRPSWEVYGIRERNLILCDSVLDILGLNNGKSWDDVRRELSDEHVKKIHEVLASLWPKDTDLIKLLPPPNKNCCRAVYLGALDGRTMPAIVTGWLPYFDEIIVAHPFINPVGIRPDYSPTKVPSKHREQTLKNVFILLLLQPYIDAGLVNLIPDPGDFNIDFRWSALKMADERTSGWVSNIEDEERFNNLYRDDHKRFLRRLPESALRQYIRNHLPEANSGDVEMLVAHMKSELASDPYALLQPMDFSEQSAPFHIIKGYNLEASMYLAAQTGSLIYTDINAHWHQLHLHTSANDAVMDSAYKPIVDSWKQITFPIDVNVESALCVRHTGKFGEMRAVIRRTVAAIRQTSHAVQSAQFANLAAQLTGAAQVMYKEWNRSAEDSVLEGRMMVSVPLGGFERNDVRRLLVTFGRTRSVEPIPMALFVRINKPMEP